MNSNVLSHTIYATYKCFLNCQTLTAAVCSLVLLAPTQQPTDTLAHTEFKNEHTYFGLCCLLCVDNTPAL